MFTWLNDTAGAERIALTLVHFLWQGTLIALLVLLSGTFLARTATARHRWSVIGLSLMVVSPFITLAWLTAMSHFEVDWLVESSRNGRSLQAGLERPPSGVLRSGDFATRSATVHSTDSHARPDRGDFTRRGGSAERDSTSPAGSSDWSDWSDGREVVGGSHRFAASDSSAASRTSGPLSSLVVDVETPSPRFSAPFSFSAVFPAAFSAWTSQTRTEWARRIVWLWLAGVALLATRVVLGVTALRWIKRNCRGAAEPTCRSVHRLSARMGIEPPRVGVSDRVTQAMVTGIWRPMIVLPAAWVAQLPPDFLEAVLTHELAHLRRRDLWIIYLQRLVETTLFFHPAVWWLSSRLQREREWCCDAFAVRVTGEPVIYVQALELVASRQRERCMPSLAAGMKGGRKMLLLSRIERVLGVHPSKSDSRPSGLLVASLVLATGFVWMAGSGHPLLAEVGEEAEGQLDREPSVEREVDVAARAAENEEGNREEKEKENESSELDRGLGERVAQRVEGQVSPEEKRELARQIQEQKQHIRELISQGQLDRARAAEEKLRRHVEESEEQRLGDRAFALREQVLPRIRQLQQRLEEAREQGRLEEVERLERELQEVKRRVHPGADPVRGRLAELQQRMMGAIKGGRPDEVVELGHQIADVMRAAHHGQPARPDDDLRSRFPERPDGRPREARPDGRPPVGPRPDGFPPPGVARPRPDRPGPGFPAELMEVVRELREEVGQLRREVNELRGERGERGEGRR